MHFGQTMNGPMINYWPFKGDFRKLSFEVPRRGLKISNFFIFSHTIWPKFIVERRGGGFGQRFIEHKKIPPNKCCRESRSAGE